MRTITKTGHVNSQNLTSKTSLSVIDNIDIQDKIFTIRGVQVKSKALTPYLSFNKRIRKVG